MGTKCKRAMMVPSEEQCRTLKLWLDGARFAYNLAVDAYNASGVYAKNALKGLAGASTGRKRRKRDKQTGELVGEPIAAGENAWQKNAPERLWTVPAKIRSRAVEMVTNAIESFKAVATNKGKPLPKLKHRKSKDKVQTFVVEAGMVNCGKAGAAYPLFGGPGARGAMRFGQKGKKKKPFVLPDTIDSDMTVTYERKSGRFYLGIPVPLDDHCPDITRDATVADGRVGIDPERSWHIAAIDPGIKTFATVYDPGRERVVSCGTHGGRKDGSARGLELIGWLCRKVSRLESHAAMEPKKSRRRNLRALAQRVRDKIRHLTDELHHKVALWLCRNYSVVLLPKFEAKRLSARNGRTMSKKSVRRMLALAPYRFRQFLLHKAREYGTKVAICNERWTSKTCTVCGRTRRDLKLKDRTYVCRHCGASYDRDAGAARNILMLYFEDAGIDLSDVL